ncbi:MAG: helix-turn-helix transcriptional regulator [Pseudomonadota bacterium]|nr:helix-turn-helix transcriptional regulator [Pseudomonadota bacterium]
MTLSLIKGKWKPMILWQLSSQRRRFTDFQVALPQVAHKVLSQQLRRLEADGLIRRRFSKASGVTLVYELTDFGRTLRPALNALASWGKTHHRPKAAVDS